MPQIAAFPLGPALFAMIKTIIMDRNFARSNADNETFCTVLLTSQVVIIQSLQPKGRALESTCVLFFFFFLPLFDSFNFIYHR